MASILLKEITNDENNNEISSPNISMKLPKSLTYPRKRLYKADKCRYNFPADEYIVPINATESN